jgi:hypothetical protein
MTATTEPTEIRAGDLIEWNRSLADYPASEWTLKYSLTNSTSKITIDASANGDVHAVSVAAADSAGFAPGYFNWVGRVTNISDPLLKYTVLSGEVHVLPDLEARSTYDGRSWARIGLDNIEAVLEKRATKDQMAYTIGDRQLSRMNPSDLWEFRDRFKSIVAQEEADAAGTNGKVVQTVF